MQKLGVVVCDNPACRKVCQIYLEVPSKTGKTLHFCSDQCHMTHMKNTSSVKRTIIDINNMP